MRQLIEQIKTRCQVSPEMEQLISQYFVREEIAKNTFILSDGQLCRKLYFMDQGLVRTFYYHQDKEITSWFYSETNFFASWYSFYAQEPGYEYIETLEDCVVYAISYQKFQSLLAAFAEFQVFGRLLAEEQVSFIDMYSKGYMFLSAKDKYKLLTEYFPNIELRVKLGQIASFLGISQETLSRIRAGK